MVLPSIRIVNMVYIPPKIIKMVCTTTSKNERVLHPIWISFSPSFMLKCACKMSHCKTAFRLSFSKKCSVCSKKPVCIDRHNAVKNLEHVLRVFTECVKHIKGKQYIDQGCNRLTDYHSTIFRQGYDCKMLFVCGVS